MQMYGGKDVNRAGERKLLFCRTKIETSGERRRPVSHKLVVSQNILKAFLDVLQSMSTFV